MKPEVLLVVANARGIRIDYGRTRPIPLEHRRGPKRRPDGTPGVLSAQGTQDRPSTPASVDGRDFAWACAGMDEDCYRTLCWSIAGEDAARIYLRDKLFNIAYDIARSEQWPNSFRRGECRCGMARACDRYVEDLVIMALTEIANPHDFTSETERAVFFGIA